MSRVYTDTLEPRKPAQDITLGTAGETISVGANSINVNTVADKGGNTLWTSDGSGNLSSVNAGLKGNLVLLDTNTFSGGSSSAFTTLINSTYDVYCFKLIDIAMATNDAEFTWNGSSDGGSNYNVIKTTSAFATGHYEDGTNSFVEYKGGSDLAQSTGYQNISQDPQGTPEGADAAGSGELYLFAPSSTTYVKHFYCTFQYLQTEPASWTMYTGGYFNTTSAIDAVDFKPSTGNFSGTIKMYGIL